MCNALPVSNPSHLINNQQGLLNSNNSSSNSNSVQSMQTYFSPSSSSASSSISASHDDLFNIKLSDDFNYMNDQQKVDYLLSQVPMPPGWQKSFTNEGEPYFINHNTRTTYWQDPRLPLIIRKMQQYKNNTQLNSQISRNSNQIEELKLNLMKSISNKNELVKKLEELSKKEDELKNELQKLLQNCNDNPNNLIIAVSDPNDVSLSALNGENLNDLNNLDLTAIEQTNNDQVSIGPALADVDSVNSLYNRLLINNNQNNNLIQSGGENNINHNITGTINSNNNVNNTNARTTLSHISLNSTVPVAFYSNNNNNNSQNMLPDGKSIKLEQIEIPQIQLQNLNSPASTLSSQTSSSLSSLSPLSTMPNTPNSSNSTSNSLNSKMQSNMNHHSVKWN
jgi:hypothetical protein